MTLVTSVSGQSGARSRMCSSIDRQRGHRHGEHDQRAGLSAARVNASSMFSVASNPSAWRPGRRRSTGCSRKPRVRRPLAARITEPPIRPRPSTHTGAFVTASRLAHAPGAPDVRLVPIAGQTSWSGTSVSGHGSTAGAGAGPGRRQARRFRRGGRPGGRQVALLRDASRRADQPDCRRDRVARTAQRRRGFRSARRRRRILRHRAARARRAPGCCCRMPPRRWTTTSPPRCWRSWTPTSDRTTSRTPTRSRRVTSGCCRISACPRRCWA